jgi:hydrogenase maturation protein HypF
MNKQTIQQTDTIVTLPAPAPNPVIAVGGELKNTMCVVEGGEARLTPVIDSLSDAGDYRRFTELLDRNVERYAGGPSLVVAHDLHPTYLSTVAAQHVATRRSSVSCEVVQHHHAHIASCMAEHGVSRPVIGIACDGTGFGTDGAIWGCEVLFVTPARFRRCAALRYFPLPGGDAAARQTWRPALALARQAFGASLPADVRAIFGRVPGVEFDVVQGMLTGGLNCPETSSLGRLFDAVAFLTGVCDVNEQEGQAAIRLQEAAEDGLGEPYPFRLEQRDGVVRVATSGMIIDICRDVSMGIAPRVIAARFHATVAAMLSDAALQGARAHGVDIVAVSGGCFYNRLLADRTEQLLHEGGISRVLRHERVSSGDAGLSLGQALVAIERGRNTN